MSRGFACWGTLEPCGCDFVLRSSTQSGVSLEYGTAWHSSAIAAPACGRELLGAAEVALREDDIQALDRRTGA